MNHERGQSMTEFAIGLAVMALMLLGSITIAGFQEVQRRMSFAARQAASEGEWAANREDRRVVVRRVANFHLQDPALSDAFGNQTLRPSDTSATASLGAAPGRARIAANLMVEPLQLAGGFLGGNFDLTPDGLLGGAIAVNIPGNAALPQPFAGMSVKLEQPFAQLTDAWNASGADHVRRRSAGLVPASALSDLQAIWRPLLAPLALIEPSLSRLCLGIIEPDRVPEDRLGAGRSPLPGRCP
jgi:hypothetical protein